MRRGSGVDVGEAMARRPYIPTQKSLASWGLGNASRTGITGIVKLCLFPPMRERHGLWSAVTT